MIEQVGRAPGRGGGPSPRVPKRDMVINEGDNLTLGATTLKFHHHPGHTPGVLSAEFTVYDNGTPHKASGKAAAGRAADLPCSAGHGDGKTPWRPSRGRGLCHDP